MAKLEYTFKTDTLFKMIFVKHPDLLKKLVAELLAIDVNSIGELLIKNPEIPPEILGGKFCRLDILMDVGGRQVDLEIQVDDEGDYPDRSLYYWAREFSSSLGKGRSYSELPQTIIISILGFSLFKDSDDFHSEFRVLEVKRHTQLTDKMRLHYFELKKLPEVANDEDKLKLWLALFKANTEEEMEKLVSIGGEVMAQAVKAYRSISATEEFRMIERMRQDMRNNETAALNRARYEGEQQGMRQGMQQGKIEIARNMLARNIDAATIAEYTGLYIDDILRL
jgi:predicted transposase/invertase (TIGR01784 family)